MSLLPGFIKARQRQDDSAPQTDAAADSPVADSHTGSPPDTELDDNIFNLLPPESSEPAAPEPILEPILEPSPEPKPQGRNQHPVDMTDLSRLSIDRDGRLYWDGEPEDGVTGGGKRVGPPHRVPMPRGQIAGASLVAAFVAIGAIGAAIQG